MASNKAESEQEAGHNNEKQPSIKEVASSVAAAFFGVQSDKNRERDFKGGKFSHFVVVGLISVVLFVGALVAIVNLVLP
ncbi:DUF2970 domain-containing protein [Thalassotalea sp. ND16A]|uniref:DUF2970 domain-containing protein n=1 Tax=Thalassotalea sp. ND16A TaxID=1535422 RepID=UPI000519EE72|nr:DUF2970 domain-containing protein [Thalassotalea sp. ND16A]KGK01084.1 hypothetical protein ND16A_3091 [Thalassotalea sp. ND16A]